MLRNEYFKYLYKFDWKVDNELLLILVLIGWFVNVDGVLLELMREKGMYFGFCIIIGIFFYNCLLKLILFVGILLIVL